MADDSKGGGGTTAIIVAVIGLIGVLGAAYIASGKWRGPHSPPPSSAVISDGSNTNGAIGNGSNSNGSDSNSASGNGGAVRPVAHMSVIVGNTSYSGADYTQLSTDSALQCSDDCLAQTRCRAMTYAASTHTCWLKTAVPSAQQGSDFSAAYKVDG